MGWTKHSDWLPLANAKAQVKFYEKDLYYAEQYLAFVIRQEKMMKRTKNTNTWRFWLKIAKDDVALSRLNLKLSKAKVEESKRLE